MLGLNLILHNHFYIHSLRIARISGGFDILLLNSEVVCNIFAREPEIEIYSGCARIDRFTEFLDDGDSTRVNGMYTCGNRNEHEQKYRGGNACDSVAAFQLGCIRICVCA